MSAWWWVCYLIVCYYSRYAYIRSFMIVFTRFAWHWYWLFLYLIFLFGSLVLDGIIILLWWLSCWLFFPLMLFFLLVMLWDVLLCLYGIGLVVYSYIWYSCMLIIVSTDMRIYMSMRYVRLLDYCIFTFWLCMPAVISYLFVGYLRWLIYFLCGYWWWLDMLTRDGLFTYYLLIGYSLLTCMLGDYYGGDDTLAMLACLDLALYLICCLLWYSYLYVCFGWMIACLLVCSLSMYALLWYYSCMDMHWLVVYYLCSICCYIGILIYWYAGRLIFLYVDILWIILVPIHSWSGW